VRQKLRFTVSASMGEQDFYQDFRTYPEWAEHTAHTLVDDWMCTLDIDNNIQWTYWPQF
jgi:hypothetical protein